MAERGYSFQEVIMRLERFWADQGCLIWQPYSEKLGAGTMNPATVLRVLGPEPWNVAYVEPSFRADDGRYAENPNRMQMHTQYQVILKPDPGNPQELYLDSLRAIGIDARRHDIRFVEDNWEAPALGAWGLGWEVWLDGLEITQFTYFQQAGGIALDPVSVEITYGLERIVMFLQGVQNVWDIRWNERRTYGDLLRDQEIDHCRYNFEVADVGRLQQMYQLYDEEARSALAHDLVVPAHDYVLRCSHTFNLLDARGAIGVTERAGYFARMRDLARQVADAYVDQRRRAEFAWLPDGADDGGQVQAAHSDAASLAAPATESSQAGFVLEIGTEELPVADLQSAIQQLQTFGGRLTELGLARAEDVMLVIGTPRRLVLRARAIAGRQPDQEVVVKGPPARAAFDANGNPAKAAQGFARSQGVFIRELEVREADGGAYVFAVKRVPGRPALEVLAEELPVLIGSLRFARSMRWNASGVAFSRPIRWIVALLGEQIVPFAYADVSSGCVSRGLRPAGSPAFEIPHADAYDGLLAEHGIQLDRSTRRRQVWKQVTKLAAEVGGVAPDAPADSETPAPLLEEVTDLVEQPFALLGQFDSDYLELPSEVLMTVMKSHQRYFPIVRGPKSLPAPNARQAGEVQSPEVLGTPDSELRTQDSGLLPYFVAVANGEPNEPEVVRAGNEAVLRARYADAAYFLDHDTRQPLEAFVPRLATLVFQEQLGSMLEKQQRMKKFVGWLVERLELSEDEVEAALRAAQLAKADLVTQMVVEMTSLQGIMGREYALRSGENAAAASALFEQYLPRYQGDQLPESGPGIVLSLVDRLDTLLGLHKMGITAAGSSDPYGLRRAAIGVIEILTHRRIPLSLREAFEVLDAWLPPTPDNVHFVPPSEPEYEALRKRVSRGEALRVLAYPSHLDAAVGFVRQRLQGWLRMRGYRHDVVEAVLSDGARNAAQDNPAQAAELAQALNGLVAAPDWEQVLVAYARCKRIVRNLEERFPLALEDDPEEATQVLLAAYQRARAQLDAAPGDVAVLGKVLRELVDPINRFFDRVLVMAEDERLRRARLGLVQHIAALPEGIADLEKLQGF